MAIIRPVTPLSMRSIAMLAKVVATSASSESGSPLRRSYVSSEASVSIPVRSRISAARASPTFALWRCPNASAPPTSVICAPAQMAPSAVMTKAYRLGFATWSAANSVASASRSYRTSGMTQRAEVTYAV